jgi:hypothetical protein
MSTTANNLPIVNFKNSFELFLAKYTEIRAMKKVTASIDIWRVEKN